MLAYPKLYESLGSLSPQAIALDQAWLLLQVHIAWRSTLHARKCSPLVMLRHHTSAMGICTNSSLDEKTLSQCPYRNLLCSALKHLLLQAWLFLLERQVPPLQVEAQFQEHSAAGGSFQSDLLLKSPHACRPPHHFGRR